MGWLDLVAVASGGLVVLGFAWVIYKVAQVAIVLVLGCLFGPPSPRV